MSECAVCERPARVTPIPGAFANTIDCRLCGLYRLSESAWEDMRTDEHQVRLLPYLSAYIRQNQRPDGTAVAVPDDWVPLAERHTRTSLPQKLRLLRELIAERSTPGASTELDEEMVAREIDARNRLEVRFLLNHLQAAGHIKLDTQQIPVKLREPNGPGESVSAQLTVPGWDAVSPVAGAGVPGTCFIAMSFDRSMDAAYEEGIVPAVRLDCGFADIRLDRQQHNDEITDRILAGIRSAEFVVADFTLQSPGVYFEAGFAAGLGRTVIWTCRDDWFDRLHFDTRQRNHIKWHKPDDLRERLTDRIRGTVSLPARLRRG